MCEPDRNKADNNNNNTHTQNAKTRQRPTHCAMIWRTSATIRSVLLCTIV